MFQKHCLLLILLIIIRLEPVLAQTLEVHGTVYDQVHGEPLPGVNIRVANSSYGTISNIEGKYQLNLSSNDQALIFSFIGYQTDTLAVVDVAQQPDHIMMVASIMAEEVIVTAGAMKTQLSSPSDVHTISSQDIQGLPYLMGEADPIKAVQLLPGVQSAGEGNTGYSVRGGTLDQNLVLLDGAPVYNAGHLFGFFSVFNGNVVDKATLIRGGISAEYGGRLSSILDIATKAGSKEQWQGEASLGMIAANAQVGGPIIKNKLSVAVAGRRTYYDLFAKGLQRSQLVQTAFNYFFHDINARLDYQPGKKHKLAVSGYVGKDYFTYQGNAGFSNDMSWANRLLSAKWQYAVSSDWLLESTAFLSQYQMWLKAGIASYQIGVKTGVSEQGWRQQLVRYFSSKGEVHVGWEVSQQAFTPNDAQAQADGESLKLQDNIILHTRQVIGYTNYQLPIGNSWKIQAGLRGGNYQHIGPYTRYGLDRGQIQDTIQFSSGEEVYGKWYLEPRISATYQVSQHALRISYDKMHQFSHMVPMSSTSLPTDSWVTSTQQVAPQRSQQYAISYMSGHQGWMFSSTAFYKKMTGQIEYRQGGLFGQSKGVNYYDNFTFGTSQAIGNEWLVEKKKGKLRGQLSYTLSRTTRKFAELNEGKAFPSKYDRRHDLSLSGKYLFSPRWTFSGIWVYASGNTMTLPSGRFMINGNVVNEYAGRNNFRMPAYHRLDLSATYESVNRNQRIRASWIFSVYNLYSRMNPYFVYFDISGNLQQYELSIKAQQVSLFPLIPSVTYRVKF